MGKVARILRGAGLNRSKYDQLAEPARRCDRVRREAWQHRRGVAIDALSSHNMVGQQGPQRRGWLRFAVDTVL